MTDRPGVARPLIGVLFVALGVALALAALAIDRQERRFRDGALTTTATIVGVLGRGPLVRFVTQAGDHVDVTVQGSRFSPHQRGETVPIYYPPDNPAFAGLDDRASRWLRTVAAASLGAVSLVTGLAVLRASQRA